MIDIKNTYKHILLLLFVLSGGIGTVNAAVQHSSKQVIDQAAIQWSSRSDVKAAVDELFSVHEKLDEFVQNIFNAYAPYINGTSREMRYRMKELARLVIAAGNVEGIYFSYFYTTKTTSTHKKNMESAKKDILFYYYDQEMIRFFNIPTSIVKELKASLDSLCKDPEFITHTKLNQVEFNNLMDSVDKAIKAALTTIPGGIAALNA